MIKDNYNFLEKYLHYLILNNKFVSELIFDIEKKIFLKKRDIKNNKHLFITGLARSGSTLLLNILNQGNKFSSLTYDDMPMILAPNLWSKFFRIKNKSLNLKKRAHGDLININISSPEAFDEVFWKFILKDNYITKDHIIDSEITEKTLSEFCNFINLVCLKYNCENYLSKNNNSIFRIESILNYFVNSFLIVPFRDPLSHSFSLMNQHKKFINLQNKDYFIEKYMNWLGHFEFGNNHKTFNFDKKNNNFLHKSNSINYWLNIWINYYEYILKTYSNSKYQDRIIFVNYNKLCENNNYLKELYSKLNIRDEINNIKIFKANKIQAIKYDQNQLRKASILYNELSM